MKTRIKMLKVKVKSLAEEARIIRREERLALQGRKPDYVLHTELRLHRVRDVRREQRVSLLAYAFLRGKALSACEPSPAGRRTGWQCIDWNRVLQLALKFGPVTPPESKAQTEARKLQVETQLKEWRSAVLAAA